MTLFDLGRAPEPAQKKNCDRYFCDENEQLCVLIAICDENEDLRVLIAICDENEDLCRFECDLR